MVLKTHQYSLIICNILFHEKECLDGLLVNRSQLLITKPVIILCKGSIVLHFSSNRLNLPHICC